LYLRKLLMCKGFIGGPGRDRTDDLFHAIKDRFANPCIYKALVAPKGPVSAPGTGYCSHVNHLFIDPALSHCYAAA
jgi:hypothetical protein